MLTVSVAYHANLERDAGAYIFTQLSLDNWASAYVNVMGLIITVEK
jgi:hypothetical protein